MLQVFELMTENNQVYYQTQYTRPPVRDDFVMGFSRSSMYFSDYAQSQLVYAEPSFRIRHAVLGNEDSLPAELNNSLLAFRALIATKGSLGDLEAELPQQICSSLRAHYAKDCMPTKLKELLLPYISGECGVPNYLAVVTGEIAGFRVSLDQLNLEQKIIRQKDGSYLYFRTQALIMGGGATKVSFAVVEQSFVIKANGSLEQPLTLIRLTKNPIIAGKETAKLEARADARTIAGASGRINTSEALPPFSAVSPIGAACVSTPGAESLERDLHGFLTEWEEHVYSLGRPALSGEESAFPEARLDELEGEILKDKIRLTAQRRTLAGMSPFSAAELPRTWIQWLEAYRTRISLRAIAITTIIAALMMGALLSLGIIPALPFLKATVAAAGLVMNPAVLTALWVVLAGLVIASILLVISTHTGSSKQATGKEAVALSLRIDVPSPSSRAMGVMSGSSTQSRWRMSLRPLEIPGISGGFAMFAPAVSVSHVQRHRALGESGKASAKKVVAESATAAEIGKSGSPTSRASKLS